MRHRAKVKTFNRDTHARQALLRSLLRSLVLEGQMVTTRAKAKEVRRWADKLIHKAQEDSLPTRRLLHRFFGKRDVVNTLVDRIAPLFTDRVSGFTRIVGVGKRRGDNSDMVKIELVKQSEIKGLKNPNPEVKAEKKVVKTSAAATTAKKAVVKKAAPKTAPKTAAKTATKKTVAKKPVAKKTTKKETTK